MEMVHIVIEPSHVAMLGFGVMLLMMSAVCDYVHQILVRQSRHRRYKRLVDRANSRLDAIGHPPVGRIR